MKKITFITGNYGKYISVKNKFNNLDIEIDFKKIDFKEPEINDITEISKRKALQAYEILQTPCFVNDSGFYIDAYPNNPGFPGAFVKRSGISENIETLLFTMKNEKNRLCRFVECLTFYDGKEFYTFYGISEGNLAFEIKGKKLKQAWSPLWTIFIPNNCNKTLAEMTEEEILTRPDGHTSATLEFINWYKETYLNKIENKLTLKN
jgi:non-canonical purine NTP pyrophosphatase (RdgB/HAM1 family)